MCHRKSIVCSDAVQLVQQEQLQVSNTDSGDLHIHGVSKQHIERRTSSRDAKAPQTTPISVTCTVYNSLSITPTRFSWRQIKHKRVLQIHTLHVCHEDF